MRAGLDIGGTKTNMGLFDNKGGLIASKKVKTLGLKEITDEFELFLRENNVTPSEYNSLESIGVGVPGTVDTDGIVLFAPNIGWRNVNIKNKFQDRWNVPFYLGQDTECGALGEFIYGAGKGAKDLICITIGTGIGCGLIIDGKIHKGKYRTAGELGHTVAVINGKQCNCGKKGCLEMYASGNGIAAAYGEGVTGEYVFGEAKKGCSTSIKIIEEAIDYLAAATVNAANLLGPEVIIFSGGISEEEIFIEPLIKKVRDMTYDILAEKLKICKAELGADAPLYGAAALGLYTERRCL